MFERSRVGLSSLLAGLLALAHVAPAAAQPQPAPPPATGSAPPPAPPPPAAPGPAPAAPAGQPAAGASAQPAAGATGQPAAGAATPGGQAAGATPDWPPPEGPVVTFQPDDPRAVLERWEFSPTEGRSAWRTVCVGTCSRPMDTRYGYRVTGDGVVNSPWFQLPAARVPINLKADVGTTAKRTTGIVLSVLGVAATAVGFGLMLDAESPENSRTGERRDPLSGQGLAGGITAGAGIVSLFVGLALIGASGTSASVEKTDTGATKARLKLPGNLELTHTGLRF